MNVDVHTTSLPLEQNAIELDPDLKDDWGLPAMRVTYRDHEDDQSIMKFFVEKAVEIMEAAGAVETWAPTDVQQSVGYHLLGTARMGNDPSTSVVDKYHRTHDVPNLFICDGSSLVTGGRGQPTCTIQALAYRAADYIADFANNGEI
jgi:choline dehydrogenase-like flavoprotein